MDLDAMVDDLQTRIDAAPGADLCSILRETDGVRPFLVDLAGDLEDVAGFPVAETLHPLLLAAAAGYALGLADAFAGVESLASVIGGES